MTLIMIYLVIFNDKKFLRFGRAVVMNRTR